MFFNSDDEQQIASVVLDEIGQLRDDDETKKKSLFDFNVDPLKEAEEVYKNLLRKLDENSDSQENGFLHSQLGNICKEGFGDYEKALEHYLTSIEILCQSISSIDRRLRNIYLSIAHILLLHGDRHQQLSIEYFQRILQIDLKSKKSNEKYLINDHNYLALLYQNEQNYSQSLFHFHRSLHYYSLIQSKSNSNEYFFSKKYSSNETIYDRKSIQSLSIEKLPDLSEIHFNLANIYFNILLFRCIFENIYLLFQSQLHSKLICDIYIENL